MPQKNSVSVAPTVFATEIDDFTMHYKLSKRERDMVVSLVRNITNSEDIAKVLTISTHTVNNHLKSIFEKTKTKSKTEILSTFLGYAADRMQSRNLFIRKPRVLIVDREEPTCNYIAQGLSERGLCTYPLTDTSQVIDAISMLNIDVVIFDERLMGSTTAAGQATGMLEVIRAACRGWPLCILLTNRADYSLDECLDRGAAGIVDIPVDLDKLFRVLMSHLAESNTARQELLQIADEATVVLQEVIAPTPQDLGSGGVFIPMEQALQKRHRLAVGTMVDLQLSPLHCKQHLRVRGQVVWRRQLSSTGLTAGVGVKFIDISAQDQLTLLECLRDNNSSCFIPLGRQVG